MMSDDDIHLTLNKMKELFGEELANPEQEPIRFIYQIKLAKYHLNRKFHATE